MVPTAIFLNGTPLIADGSLNGHTTLVKLPKPQMTTFLIIWPHAILYGKGTLTLFWTPRHVDSIPFLTISL